MNKYIRKYILIFMAGLLALYGSAQENEKPKKVNLGVAVGFNFFGPSEKMGDFMIEHNYDETTSGFFSDRAITHPHYLNIGFTTQISYAQYIGKKSQLGLLINFSHLSTVCGAHSQWDLLSISFNDFSFVPFYIFEVDKIIELQGGPAFMFNSGNKTNSGSTEPKNNYSKFSLGLLAGINLKLWDKTMSYGKINTYYMITYNNKMGPYNSADLNQVTNSIPETNINFSHLNIVFAVGLNL